MYWNDVKIPTESVNDWPETWHQNHPNLEGGEVNCHKHYTRKGDHVLIIGGGRGVSTVRAAREVGIKGSVTVYEGSLQYVELINQVIELNEMADRCTTKHAIVGPGFNLGAPIYNDQNSEEMKQIPPQDLPDCDVLELDCEGAEFNILPEISIKPRIIIVEIHPGKIPDSSILSLFERLSALNYRIIDRRTNKGEVVTHNKLQELLNEYKRANAMAPVVAFVNEKDMT